MSNQKYPVVYFYKKTADCGRELRYSLRSLKNINNFDGRVFVVGDREDWFANLTVIRSPKSNYSPYQDVEYKMLAAIHDPQVPDNFILMNDDIYITKKATVRNLHGGQIKDDGVGYYNRSRTRTKKFLLDKGIKEPLNYSIHVPMLINKQKRLEVHKIIRNSFQGVALLARNVYGNIHNLGGEFYEDKKTKTMELKEGEFISTQFFTEELHELFPDPSQYETPPKPTVHMIWLGSPIPTKYRRNIQSYEKLGYKVKVWTEPPKLENQELFDAATTYALKSDIMRLEILYQEGGIYTDIDSRMRATVPITDDLICMTSASGYIANETIYATQGHPAVKEAIENLQKHVNQLKGTKCNIWDIAGATYITPIFVKYDHTKLPHSKIGSFKHRPRLIEHQYDGSWTNGRPKAEKRNLKEWIKI